MIVHCYPADDYGCGFYRIGAPAQILAHAGHEVFIHPAAANDGVAIVNDSVSGGVIAAAVPPGTDVVIMQRVAAARAVEAIRLLRSQGIAVVVDIDDDLERIDPNNGAFLGYHPNLGHRRQISWVNVRAACQAATMVTVSTPTLLDRYAAPGRGAVLPNRVPAATLTYPRVDSGDVGWAGSVHSHPADLQVVGTAVARLQDQGVRYRGVGPAEGLREALGLRSDPDVTGTLPIEEWMRGVAGLGVGMAPLADTAFNAAKSWLKVLEMSAVGVPWVASPRAEYRRFSDLHGGVGLFADRPKDWLRQLKRLATDPALRADQSWLGRCAAATNTYEEHAWRWWEAWDQAMMLERRGRPVLGKAVL